MGKPKAPKAPDYAAAAQAQGEANVNSAIATNYLNQANQIGPDGSLVYTYSQPGSGLGYTTKDGQYIPQVTATTTLSPAQQKLYNQNITMSTGLNDLGIKGLGYVGDAVKNPLKADQFGHLTQNVDRGDMVMDPGQMGTLQGGLATSPYQSSYDFSNAGAMPKAEDFAGIRDQITNAMIERNQPQMDRARSMAETQLYNQGLFKGGEAEQAAQDQLGRNENDFRLAAMLQGDQAQQNAFENAMGIRQQGIDEATAQGNIYNQAASGDFTQALQAGQFGNQALQDQFAAALQGAQFQNAAQGQDFSQGLASGQFTNQAIQQAIQQADYFRNQPLNMLNSLRTGNQANIPQFGNVTAGASIAAAPIYQATADQYSAAMNAYNAKMQGFGSITGGLASLGGAAIMASDRRLKTGIEKLGEFADGLGVYSYRYIWGKVKQIGVMADEVRKLRPWALGPELNGYATVNYGAL